MNPVLKISRIKDVYEKQEPSYPHGIMVPAIVDVPNGKVVISEFEQMTMDFSSEWMDY